jgi:hypothetical protein
VPENLRYKKNPQPKTPTSTSGVSTPAVAITAAAAAAACEPCEQHATQVAITAAQGQRAPLLLLLAGSGLCRHTHARTQSPSVGQWVMQASIPPPSMHPYQTLGT